MKIALAIIGVLLILGGAIWFFQGINVLPGSAMTGQMKWAIYGVIAVLAGVVLLILGVRRRVSSGKD
ncbi:MAG: hypothetical protein ABSG98_01385 [Anaerolineales bacterium]|jgi:hypothetical protein